MRYEFRLKTARTWEEVSLQAYLDLDGLMVTTEEETRVANAVAREISEIFDAEVRWNREGFLQGHYVRA